MAEVRKLFQKNQNRDAGKKQKRNANLAAAGKKKSFEERQYKKELRAKAFKSAEAYVKEYKALENQEIANKRKAKAAGQLYYEPEAKVVCVVRIRGIIGIPPKTRKILQLLRLRQIHNCVFVKMNRATLNMLRLVEPFIAYGEPNLKTVQIKPEHFQLMKSVTSGILEKEFEKADADNNGKIDRSEFTTLYNALVDTRVPSWDGEEEYCIVMPAADRSLHVDRKELLKMYPTF